MSREIKFKVWDTKLSLMLDWESITDTQVFWDALEGIDAEIMQFTGLLDKNGKEIYEGDIVKHPSGETGVVFICFSGQWRVKYTDEIDIALFLQINDSGLAKVIGNIYENPELLEVRP